MNALPTVTVVIADDHRLFVNGLAAILNKQPNISVTITAANGQELIEKLEHTDALPHICLLDISMPVMNGYQTLPVLVRRWPTVRVIALSMHHEDEYPVLKMAAEGACGFLGKDAEPSEIIEAIHQVYTYGYYGGGSVAVHLPNGPAAAKRLLVNITDNQMEFLQLCCTAMDYNEIAEKMGKSRRTIDNYRDNLFSKLNVKSRAGLCLFAHRAGLSVNVK